MALAAGIIYFTLEFAKDLKDKDWFGKQDPYCIIQCGNQTVRTRTAVDGGKNPVWNETFQFQVINDNSIIVTIKDEDVGKDDKIGVAHFSLVRARESKMDHVQVPVQTTHGKQKGLISATIKFEPNKSAAQAAQAPAPQYPYPAAGYAQPQYPGYPPQPYGGAPGYGVPPPYQAAPQGYGAPSPYGAPQYGVQQYGAPAPAYPPQPAQGYGAPAPYPSPMAPGYGAPAAPYPQQAPQGGAYPQYPNQYPPQYPPRPY